MADSGLGTAAPEPEPQSGFGSDSERGRHHRKAVTRKGGKGVSGKLFHLKKNRNSCIDLLLRMWYLIKC